MYKFKGFEIKTKYIHIYKIKNN